jgi:hypothetical protein
MNSPPCGKCESQCENVLDGPCYRLGHNKISGDLDLAIMNNPTCKSKQFQPEVPNQEIPKNYFKTVWKRRVTSLISPTILLPTRKRTTVLVRSTDHNHVQARNYTIWLRAPWSCFGRTLHVGRLQESDWPTGGYWLFLSWEATCSYRFLVDPYLSTVVNWL